MSYYNNIIGCGNKSMEWEEEKKQVGGELYLYQIVR
jgi:hypothetical protein